MQLIPIPPKKRLSTAGCIWIAIGVTILALVSGLAFAKPTPLVATASDACYMAQKFVKAELKSPSTASFAPCRAPDSVVTQTNRLWHVQSWVDAQNGFGATLRNDFTAELIYYPATDTWTLTELAMDTR